MKINAKTRYCQTCGIPLDIDYTILEANQNAEYCDYCLQNGVKLYDFSMDYLIYLWGLFPEEYYKETGINRTSEELRVEMSNRLPNIKRWKQKLNTAHVQYGLIIRVQEYINRHLFDDLDSVKLSHVAGISKYYFRRLFKAVCGENIGIYIQRLRLEYIAFKLITTDASVPKLLGQINYQNKHTLSRAFKSYFNCSIPEFRKRHLNLNPERKNPIQIEPAIEKISGIRIAYLKLERTPNVSYNFSVLWKQLLQFSEKYEHFSRDRSTNELNMHCHLIVSRKDQSNKVKISPLTNHRNTKNGAIKGGFDRSALFQNVEKGFDKLFGYNRQLSETFEYCNIMKNGSITDQLKMQEREVNTSVQQHDSKPVEKQIDSSIKQSINQSTNISDWGLSSVLGIFTPEPSLEEPQQSTIPKKKKKKPKRGFRQS